MEELSWALVKGLLPYFAIVLLFTIIAGIFYRAGFIEKFSSGIERIIGACRENVIPEPEFIEECGGFSVKFRKEFAELNERQNKALQIIKEKGTITNSEYQAVTGLEEKQAKEI